MNKYKIFFIIYKYFRGLFERERERRNMNREVKNFFWINDMNNIIVGR